MQEMLIFQLFSVELQPKSPVSCKNRHEIFDVQEYNIKCNTFYAIIPLNKFLGKSRLFLLHC